MQLAVTKVADRPCYFLTGRQTVNPNVRIANVIYECQIANFDFTPTPECLEIQFVDTKAIIDLEVSDTVKKKKKIFDPQNHTQPI